MPNTAPTMAHYANFQTLRGQGQQSFLPTVNGYSSDSMFGSLPNLDGSKNLSEAELRNTAVEFLSADQIRERQNLMARQNANVSSGAVQDNEDDGSSAKLFLAAGLFGGENEVSDFSPATFDPYGNQHQWNRHRPKNRKPDNDNGDEHGGSRSTEREGSTAVREGEEATLKTGERVVANTEAHVTGDVTGKVVGKDTGRIAGEVVAKEGSRIVGRIAGRTAVRALETVLIGGGAVMGWNPIGWGMLAIGGALVVGDYALNYFSQPADKRSLLGAAVSTGRDMWNGLVDTVNQAIGIVKDVAYSVSDVLTGNTRGSLAHLESAGYNTVDFASFGLLSAGQMALESGDLRGLANWRTRGWYGRIVGTYKVASWAYRNPQLAGSALNLAWSVLRDGKLSEAALNTITRAAVSAKNAKSGDRLASASSTVLADAVDRKSDLHRSIEANRTGVIAQVGNVIQVKFGSSGVNAFGAVLPMAGFTAPKPGSSRPVIASEEDLDRPIRTIQTAAPVLAHG